MANSIKSNKPFQFKDDNPEHQLSAFEFNDFQNDLEQQNKIQNDEFDQQITSNNDKIIRVESIQPNVELDDFDDFDGIP